MIVVVVRLSLQIIAFDELKTDYKNPIDQCNTLNPVSDVAAAAAAPSNFFDCMNISS